jgi:hypothetical protein|tara:strand:- start:449 stop:880 length:432 start_codon:yes stop_codon:yes gene_type:complete
MTNQNNSQEIIENKEINNDNKTIPSSPPIENPKTSETSENSRKAYNFFKGFGKSVLIAFIVGLAGGVFEAIILFPIFKIVTMTLGPLLLFGIINLHWLLRKTQNYYEKWGLGIGFLAGIITIITSLITFLIIVAIFKIPLGFQ